MLLSFVTHALKVNKKYKLEGKDPNSIRISEKKCWQIKYSEFFSEYLVSNIDIL